MSRIAKNSIKIDEHINCNFNDGIFHAKGKLGEKQITINPNFEVNIKENNVSVVPKSDKLKKDPIWGTTRALIANIIIGVSKGFTKELELVGVGYQASTQGNLLKLQLGFSHDIFFDVPPSIKVSADRTLIKIEGIDKQLVGIVAAKVRSFRPPEPYKGKGVRYKGEHVRSKQGKTVGAK